jgi:hypothetical protein
MGFEFDAVGNDTAECIHSDNKTRRKPVGTDLLGLYGYAIMVVLNSQVKESITSSHITHIISLRIRSEVCRFIRVLSGRELSAPYVLILIGPCVILILTTAGFYYFLSLVILHLSLILIT